MVENRKTKKPQPPKTALIGRTIADLSPAP